VVAGPPLPRVWGLGVTTPLSSDHLGEAVAYILLPYLIPASKGELSVVNPNRSRGPP